jgi:site-specific DNA-methyltransferase (adenine-specific)
MVINGGVSAAYLINTASPTTPKQTGGIFDNPEISAERTGGTRANKYGTSVRHWDIAPPPEYFKELFRVSKNQIIWGGNYFNLPPTRCFVVWRKPNVTETFTMAMCEYAWTSFNANAKWWEGAPQGTKTDPRFHPTQKPIALYEWLLSNYANHGDKILDTHVGSASSLVACHHQGFKFVGFEIDEEYYRLASERLEAEKAQVSLFEVTE